MSFKVCDVIMLPTDEKAENSLLLDVVLNKLKIANRNNSGNKLFDTDSYDDAYKFQHLYFLSDEEIKEGDWYPLYDGWNNKIVGFEQWDGKTSLMAKAFQLKVIATTDMNLLWHDRTPHGENVNGLWKILPQPPQSFIEYFVSEYNKGNIIRNAMVEYEKILVGWEPDYSLEHLGIDGSKNVYEEWLKVDPKDNTINIRKVKDSWTREEAIELIKEAVAVDNSEFIYKHIEKTNPHSGERDAFQGIPSLKGYNWNTESTLIFPDDEKIDKEMLYPASKLDVKRYMKGYQKGSEFPPIVLVDDGNKYHIFDGSHRLQAAINLNVPIKAYIGYKK